MKFRFFSVFLRHFTVFRVHVFEITFKFNIYIYCIMTSTAPTHMIIFELYLIYFFVNYNLTLLIINYKKGIVEKGARNYSS